MNNTHSFVNWDQKDSDLVEAWNKWYATLPDDLRRKLSIHDFRRLGECFRKAFNIPRLTVAKHPNRQWEREQTELMLTKWKSTDK